MKLSPNCSFKSLIVLAYIRSLTHFELIFLYNVVDKDIFLKELSTLNKGKGTRSKDMTNNVQAIVQGSEAKEASSNF